MKAKESTTEALTQLNRIRVVGVLSRFPIHRLSKTGTVAIDLKTTNEQGEADVQWKVSYNSEYGQPGPHAYKVDTLIVNRRIDETRRPVPELIRLGSLNAICTSLGLTLGGSNLAEVKRALHQNASAYITAKIRYKLKSGREQWSEIGYTRYAVIFTGERLPNGKVADAVYISLNSWYRELLNEVETRPLDYDYLVELAPGPQRLYELLSFPMYGSLLNGRPRARLVYSQYCLYAPQTRYHTFDQVKKQMYKVNLPHRESGYITKVEYEETLDQKGQPDWEMFYTPGPKAFREHEAFAKKHSSALLPTRKPTQQSLILESGLLEALTGRGVTAKKAEAIILQAKPGQDVMEQIEYVDRLVTSAPEKYRNPAGFYITFIEENTPVPENFYSTRKLQEWEAKEKSKNAAVKLTSSPEYEAYVSGEVERLLSEMSQADYTKAFEGAAKRYRTQYRHMKAEQIQEAAEKTIKMQLKASVKSFEQWSALSAD